MKKKKQSSGFLLSGTEMPYMILHATFGAIFGEKDPAKFLPWEMEISCDPDFCEK